MTWNIIQGSQSKAMGVYVLYFHNKSLVLITNGLEGMRSLF